MAIIELTIACKFCFPAPTGPPLNPRGTTTTLIHLNWSSPEPIHVNGIIDHYEIRIEEVYTRRVFSLLTDEESALIGPLHPYYIYTCKIAAYTVGLGPFSQPISVQAGESRKFNISCTFCRVIIFFINRTNCTPSKHLIW